MIPIITVDEQVSMHADHFSRPAKYFDAYNAEYLSMRYDKFIKDRSFQNGNLTIHIKVCSLKLCVQKLIVYIYADSLIA